MDQPTAADVGRILALVMRANGIETFKITREDMEAAANRPPEVLSLEDHGEEGLLVRLTPIPPH